MVTANSERRKKLKAQRFEAGFCVYCGKVAFEIGKKGCANCLLKKIKETVKYSKNRKDRIHLYNKKVRQKAVNKYGGKCVCCGETELYFLTIDHINNDGAMERKSYSDKNAGGGTGFFLELIREELRDDLQILCYNCNMGRYINGGICPHHKPSPKSFELKEDLRNISHFDKGCKINWPSNKKLIKMIIETSATDVSRKLGVHLTAVINRLKRRKLYHLIKEKNRSLNSNYEQSEIINERTI